MSTPRHPNRLKEYASDKSFYPRELTELNGILYFIGDDGVAKALNKQSITTIQDSGSVKIGDVNPSDGGTVTIPDATTTKLGLVKLSTEKAKSAGTAAVGVSTLVARQDHVHPAQTTVSGNAGTATKLLNARSIGLSGVTAVAQSFNGTADISIEVKAVPATLVTGLATVATSGKYDDLNGIPSIPEPASDTTTELPVIASTAAIGESSKFARADHVHPVQTTISGNAGTATKLKTARTINLSGVTTEAAASFDGSANVSIKVTAVPASIVTGLATVATSGKYTDLTDKPTIPSAATSSDTPKAAGTANAGSSAKYALADHVHPAQTTVSGNAGSATKLATARTIALSGAATGTATPFNGTANITIPVTSIDGTKITGTIPLSSIPKGAQERLFITETDTTRLALTADDVQNGDVVKVQDTGIMYYVVDDSKLGNSATAEAAFEVFTAGAASSVDWAGISNKPSFATVATSGKYTDLTDKPTIPSGAATSDLPKIAGTANAGTSAKYARIDHVHPAQTTVSGNAGSATKLATARTINLTGVTTEAAASFDGSANVSIKVTAVPATLVTGLATVATSGKYSDLTGTPTTGTASVSGLTKLYTSTGTATDGTMTRTAITNALSGKSNTSHTHNIYKITTSETDYSAGSVPIGLRSMISGIAANVTAFLPASAITVEYTTDGGTTWTDYGFSDNQKRSLFAQLKTNWARLGGPSITKDTFTTNCWLRLTVEPTDRYTSADLFYCWFTTLGHTCTVDIERSTKGAPDTFAAVRTAIPVSGWSGPNTVPFKYGTFGGGSSQTTNNYKYRFTFKATKLGTSSTSAPQVTDLRMYGSNVWTVPNNYVGTGVPYSMDVDLGVTFPNTVTASKGFVGNASSATKLATARTINLSGVTTEAAASFDGSANVSIKVTAVPASIVTGLATVATSGSYTDLSNKPSLATVATSGNYSDLSGAPSIPSASSTTPKVAASTAAVGTSTTYARADHVHPLQTTVSGNAGSATKLATARTLNLSGVTTKAGVSFDGSADVTIEVSAVPATLVTGLATVATSGSYTDLSNKPTIPIAGTTTPKVAASTAAVGTSTTYARADHVHPLQTTVSGNAGSATKLATARTINGKSFNGTANITITADPTQNELAASKDLNTVEDSGYYYGTTCTNGPTGITEAFNLQVIYTGNDYLTQILTDSANKMYVRLIDYSDSTTSYGEWQPIYNAANPSPHPTITAGTNTTTTSSPNSGATFTAIDSITKDSNGHVTAYRTKTVTMPTNAKHGIGYGTCSTSASTSAKVVSCANFVLQTGGIIAIRFTYAVTGSMTLNVNGTGAKTAYNSGSTFTTGLIKAGDTATFVYNGSYYYLMSISSPSKTYTANVSTTWTGSEAPYTQTISISGITANDNPIVDVVPSTTYDDAKTQISEYGKIYKITTSTDSITVYATEKTETTVPIQLKCVK